VFKRVLGSVVVAAVLPIVFFVGARHVAASGQSEGVAGLNTQRHVLIPASSRKTAPDFTLPDAQGQPIQMSKLKGKVVLLDFWATWCGGCKLEIPWYMEFDQKYKAQGLAVLGVAMDDDGWKAVRPFLVQEKDPETGGRTAMKYPVVLGSEGLAKQYGLTSMPMTVLIDREGRVAFAHTGVVDRADFEGHVRELLR
jgi:peroxiredoxin